MSLRYLSVCSGIEAATVAWGPLGFTAAAFSEVEPFPCAVLAHHYPGVPNLGDMTRIDGAAYRGLVDILVGGTPCQAFSVAGLRQGLEDARGNLTLTFLELANAIDPSFVVWENVPGVLSDKTNAFGCLLGGLVGADNALENVGGWPNCGVVRGPRRTAAWRVLDAQYFGLAQRRQRVFLVACPRNGADPAEVLFERQGVQRHSAPSREAGQGTTLDAAPCLRARSNASHRLDTEAAVACITGPVTHALKADGFDASEDGTGCCIFQLELQNQGSGGNRGFAHMDEPGFTMNTAGPQGVVCFGGGNTSDRIDVATTCKASGGLDFKSETFAVSVFSMRVRRLMCEECEKLQGFSRGYTRIPWRGKPAESCPDGPRYKALGNSMAVPCMRWIGERIKAEARRVGPQERDQLPLLAMGGV